MATISVLDANANPVTIEQPPAATVADAIKTAVQTTAAADLMLGTDFSAVFGTTPLASGGALTVGSHAVTNAGTFAVQAAQAGTWTLTPGNTPNTTPWLVSLHDGTTKASVADLTNSNPLHVAMVDGSGTQITSFGGGTEYTEGTTDSTITGHALLWEDAADTLRAVSSAKPLPVNVVSGSSSGTEYTEGAVDTTIAGTAILWEDTGDTLRAVSLAKPLPVVAAPGDAEATIGTTDVVRVAIFDASNNQITTFGSGIQYTEAATDTTITGTAMLWEDAADTLRAVSSAKPLPVNVVSGSSSGTEYTEGATDATITGTAILWEDTADTLRVVSVAKPLPVVAAAGAAEATISTTPVVRVAIFDAANNQITTFGSGVQYTEGDVDATIQGPALLWEDASDTLRPVSAAKPLPISVATIPTHAVTQSGTWNIATVTAVTGITNALPAGTNNIGDVDVLSLPALPAGANNIGDVDVVTVPADPFGLNADAASATGSISAKLRFIASTGIPVTGTVTVGSHNVTNAGTFAVQATQAGTWNIATVTAVTAITNALPAGTNNIGDVDVLSLPALPAGTANIGDVDVLTVPADPFGLNADAASASGSISAKLRFIASTGIPITGTVTVGSHAVTNAGTFATQATQAGTWTVQPGNTANTTPWLASIHDGTTKASVADLTNSNPLHVAMVDGAGTQITSFGGGTQYAEGATAATITGTAMLWEDTADTLRSVSAAKPLPVNIVAGSSSGTEYTEGATDSTITGTAILWEDAADTLVAVSAAKPMPISVATIPTHAVTQSGTWNIGTVTAVTAITNALPAGTNNIGDVDVITVPADPFGLNADAASATGSISAKLRFIASTGIPITGTVTVGSHAVTNAGTFATQATQAGTWNIGTVTAVTAITNALPAGTNTIGAVNHTTTGIGHGVTTVTTAGTDVVLAGSTAAKWVCIQSQTDNTGKIAIGATGVDATIATGTGVLLSPGESFTCPCDNLADFFIDATVNGEGVRYTYGT